MAEMPGPTVILLGKDQAMRNELIRQLDALRDEFENLKITGLDPAMISPDLEKGAQVIVLEIDHWTHSDEMMISGLRGTGYRGPVLILGHKDPKEELPSTRLFDKVVFMNKPFNPKELLGVVRRMVLAPIIAARKHPRHSTNETAELSIEGQNVYHACRVRNMSKGGAYLEFERSLNVRIGEAVLLKIRLGKVDREYVIKARVAWLNRGAGFGIEFVSAMK